MQQIESSSRETRPVARRLSVTGMRHTISGDGVRICCTFSPAVCTVMVPDVRATATATRSRVLDGETIFLELIRSIQEASCATESEADARGISPVRNPGPAASSLSRADGCRIPVELQSRRAHHPLFVLSLVLHGSPGRQSPTSNRAASQTQEAFSTRRPCSRSLVLSQSDTRGYAGEISMDVKGTEIIAGCVMRCTMRVAAGRHGLGVPVS